jgi:tRNA 2-thiouridine synthesizing protein E
MATLELDGEGFLVDLGTWNEAVAVQLAATIDIPLSDDHWEIIHLTRRFYQQYKLSPAMRPLVTYVRQQLGADKGNSIYLMRLFPGSPAKVLSKIAGLPKPDNCL